MKISVIIITLNEEKNIGRCLESVQSIADEIIVVDSLSSDKTRKICEEFKVQFIEQKFLGYIQQKNFALSLASHNWVLSLDADEELSIELMESIKKIKLQATTSNAGFKFNRLTCYNGQWIHHCGWYPDTKMRLANKSLAKWGGTNPHDVLMAEGEIEYLKGNLLHYSYESISSHVLQTNKFSSIEAVAQYESGKRASVAKLVTRPIYQFFKDYILKRGFLDGFYGFVICFINSVYVLLKYAKMLDLEQSKKI